MTSEQTFLRGFGVTLGLVALLSCGSDNDTTDSGNSKNTLESSPAGDDAGVPSTATDPGFGSANDVERAAEIWEQVNEADFESWPLLPGSEPQQRGQTPHGYFVTRIYDGELDPLADGLTLAKMNFSPEGVFAALTVMAYQEGYDPDNSNWFYAKFLPDGTLAETPTEAPLAGAIEPGPGKACRGCHRNAVGGDFMFWNDGPPP